MGTYREITRHPGVVRVLISQLSARFPFGMLSIILLLHIQQSHGDYTSAGIVLAAQSVGQAVSGPLSSRFMSKWGMRRVLAVTSLLGAILLIMVAFVHLPLPFVTALALLVGLSTPPVTPAVRTIYPKLVPSNQLSPLFSLDAAAQEIIWVLGPVVAVFVTGQFSTEAGLCAAAAFMLFGGAWFFMSEAVGSMKLPPSKRSLGAVLRYPTVVLTTVIGFFFVASFAALEAGIVAAFADGDAHGSSMESGIVLAVFASGSLVGGLLFGHKDLRPWSLALRMLLVLAGTLACLVSLNPWWLSSVLFIGGIGTAPTFAALSVIVSATVKFSETAEAYGWVGMGQLVGVAAGSAFAGVAIDVAEAPGAILVSAGLLAAGTLIAIVTVKFLPDLKGRTIEPPPETGTITIPLP